MEDYREIEAKGREVCDNFPTASFSQIDCFSRQNKGKNIVTPNTIRYLSLGNGRWVVEVAWGRGIRNETMYGVTVVEALTFPFKRRPDLACPCFSDSELEEALTRLDLKKE